MKLSFLLLSALLALSSASLLDIVKQSSEHRNESLPKPDPKHRVPKITANMLMPAHESPLSPDKIKQKKEAQSSPSTFNNNGKLKWQTWGGSLPYGAVSIYNSYTERVDYVCKNGCHAGFYYPGKGSYCQVPIAGVERPYSQFDILVNEDNFEILEWKEDSYGSVPKNSIRNCIGDEYYVGKNKYGLGKVHRSHECFYLPYEGDEYWYRYYDVLTVNRDVLSEQISNVEYNMNAAELLEDGLKTMYVSDVINNECDTVSKTALLEKTSRVERRWDISSSVSLGIATTFTGGIPLIASGSIEISPQVSFEFSGGHTYSEETSHSVSVELNVPPNHYCRVLMMGRQYMADVPYTAHVRRTYRNGAVTNTQITGTYKGVEVGNVCAVIERFQPVPNPEPCP